MSNGNGQILFRYYGNRLSMAQAGPGSDGWLSSIDWNRFNNTALGFAPVTSVFGRLGAVVAQPGDYNLNQINPPTSNWTLAGGLRIKASGVLITTYALQLWNPDQNLWHTLQVRGTAGAEYITIGAGEP